MIENVRESRIKQVSDKYFEITFATQFFFTHFFIHFFIHFFTHVFTQVFTHLFYSPFLLTVFIQHFVIFQSVFQFLFLFWFFQSPLLSLILPDTLAFGFCSSSDHFCKNQLIQTKDTNDIFFFKNSS